MIELFRKLVGKLKGKKSDGNLSLSNTNQSRKNKKVKKNKGQQVVDSSSDSSITVAGDDNTVVAGDGNTVGSHINSETNNYFGGETLTPDLVVIARWNNLVPRETKIFNDFGVQTRVLVPSDSNFICPAFSLELSEQYDERNALYILIQRNPFIKNVKLKAVKMKLNTCQYETAVKKSIVGFLDTPKAFTIQCADFRVGSGTITLIFEFEKEGLHYEQPFTFVATNDRQEFVMQEYIEPEQFIDIDHFSFYK